MKIFNTPILQSPKLKQVTNDHKRHYETESGEKFTSVTTFLSKTKDEKDVKVLNEWRKRVGEKEANRVSNQATSFGTKLHSACEMLLSNKYSLDLFEGSLPFQKRFDPIKDFLEEKVDVLLGSEIMVYSPTLKLAGSVDLVYRDKEGNVIVADFKTSKKKKKIEWCQDYMLQVSLYSLMISELFDLKIDNGLLLFSYDDGSHEPILFSPEKYFGTLQKRIEKFRRLLKEEKELQEKNLF
jgi:CRISPR/Cas system-associated exonuclease Cas4 (RecB family)